MRLKDSLLINFANADQLKIPGIPSYLYSLGNLKIITSEKKVTYDFLKEHPILNILKKAYLQVKMLTNFENVIWLSTTQGIIKINFKRSLFKPFKKAQKNPLDYYYTRKIRRDSRGNMIINHVSKGLWINVFPTLCC